MKKTLALMTVLSSIAATPALAADVEFNATVDSQCTIGGVVGGTLTANAAVDQLSSGATGAGTFDVTANATIFTLAVSDPTAWDLDPGSVPTTSFASSATLGTETATPSSPVNVPNGTTSGTVDLTASVDPGFTFPNGSYTATVVLTCE